MFLGFQGFPGFKGFRELQCFCGVLVLVYICNTFIFSVQRVSRVSGLTGLGVYASAGI